MGKEFERTERVSQFLHKELAHLLQTAVRDPRVEQVNLTGVEVSRDLSYAKVFFTLMDDATPEYRAEMTRVLEKVAGFFKIPISQGFLDANCSASGVSI